jgi:hypothetical protein
MRVGSSFSPTKMRRRTSPSASSTAPSPPMPSPPNHEGRISSTSNADFSRAKSMRRSRRAEQGEHPRAGSAWHS